ncbi:MAG: purine-binding chemotaxis protein CheW [Nitrospinae bacterium]|nr:purine-binding chemotaxis protein CheW [Nitrospinota bacterium]
MDIGRIVLEKGYKPTREEIEKVLRERAKILALRPEERSKEDHREVVEFVLSHERYAFISEYVREIYPLKGLTPVPNTPPFVLGIINVRGEILSVIDIRRFFDLPEKGLTDKKKAIILHYHGMEFAVLSDDIVGVRRLSLSELQTSLQTLSGVREKYLLGVTTERLIVLDAVKLLTDKDIIVDENV